MNENEDKISPVHDPDFGYAPKDRLKCAQCHAPYNPVYVEKLCPCCGQSLYEEDKPRDVQCPNCKAINPGSYWITVWILGPDKEARRADYQFLKFFRFGISSEISCRCGIAVDKALINGDESNEDN